MRVTFLVVALLLMSASLLAFLLGSPGAAADVKAQRSMVRGHVRGDIPGTPWAGAVAMLGTERVILGEDGAFRFAVMPGRYHLDTTCRFAARNTFNRSTGKSSWRKAMSFLILRRIL
jgi:hypothetical protein